MTRRQLAKALSADLTRKGRHYVHGTTLYKTDGGEWGAFVGLVRPPNEAAWYENVGWDVVAERNTALKVEAVMRRLEVKFEGRAERIDRASILKPTTF